jgi:hypothetical protein
MGIDTTAPRPRRVRSAGRRKKRLQQRNFLKRHTWDASDNMLNLSKIMDKENIFLGVSDVEDLITSEIMQQRIEADKTTVQRETTVLANRTSWKKWAEKQFKDELFVQTNSSSGFIVERETHNFIKFDVNSNSTTVRAFGDAEYADDMIEIVETQFDVVTSYIEWVYGGDGNSVNVPLNRARLPIKEMYPFLGEESLEDYYDRYMDWSSRNWQDYIHSWSACASQRICNRNL